MLIECGFCAFDSKRPSLRSHYWRKHGQASPKCTFRGSLNFYYIHWNSILELSSLNYPNWSITLCQVVTSESKKSPLILFMKDVERSFVDNPCIYTALQRKLKKLAENIIVIGSYIKVDKSKEKVIQFLHILNLFRDACFLLFFILDIHWVLAVFMQQAALGGLLPFFGFHESVDDSLNLSVSLFGSIKHTFVFSLWLLLPFYWIRNIYTYYPDLWE